MKDYWSWGRKSDGSAILLRFKHKCNPPNWCKTYLLSNCFATFHSLFLHKKVLLVSDETVSDKVTILIITRAFRLLNLKGTQGLDADEETPLSFDHLHLSVQFPNVSTLQSCWIATISPPQSNLLILHITKRLVSSVQPLKCLAALKSLRRRQQQQQQQQQQEACLSSALPLRTLSIGSSADNLSVPKTSSDTF